MHPIERLRFVARAVGVDDRLVALEATSALMTFSDNQAALVAGCRRILARQPCCGPLWWACARLLTAEDLWATAQETLSMLDDDPTEAALAYALGETGSATETDRAPVGIERARALGNGRVVLAGGDGGARSGADRPSSGIHHRMAGDVAPEKAGDPRAATGDTEGRRWIVAGVGTHLSPPMFEALERAMAAGGTGVGRAVVADLGCFTHVVGPHGPVPVVALEESDCPVAPELFSLDG